MSNMLRKLRTSFSAICAVACLLLIALWIRSFWQVDTISGPALPKLKCGMISSQGRIIIVWSSQSPFPSKWELVTQEVKEGRPFFRQFENMFGFAVVSLSSEQEIILPHWFLVAITATCAVAPWLKWSRQFSLRTLLIGMTLVAAVLGAIVYAIR
jgi:hypothetical protein